MGNPSKRMSSAKKSEGRGNECTQKSLRRPDLAVFGRFVSPRPFPSS
jgi:hypothetical protein